MSYLSLAHYHGNYLYTRTSQKSIQKVDFPPGFSLRPCGLVTGSRWGQLLDPVACGWDLSLSSPLLLKPGPGRQHLSVSWVAAVASRWSALPYSMHCFTPFGSQRNSELKQPCHSLVQNPSIVSHRVWTKSQGLTVPIRA